MSSRRAIRRTIVAACGLLAAAVAIMASAASAMAHVQGWLQVKNASTACDRVARLRIPASSIGLPTRGAVVSSARLQRAGASSDNPEFCKVLGSVLASKPSDPPIRFEINMPTKWNLRALQMGGGGFDGTVVDGLGRVPNTPADVPTPLSQGYVTFGGDSGHEGNEGEGSFGANAQALANYAGESVKRTHDAAMYLIRVYYMREPVRMYFAGESKGGQEALVAAERYGADYDGVISYYPAAQNPALPLSWYRMWSAAYNTPGGALDPAQQALLKAAVLRSCDALDGAKDGIVSDVAACGQHFNVMSLRCPGGRPAGDTCLSDTQIRTLRIASTPMTFAFPMAWDVKSIGPYPVFDGGDIAGNLFDPTGTNGRKTFYYLLDDGEIRYFIRQNHNTSSDHFNYWHWRKRIQYISSIFDTTDPNLDAFRNHGGKLLLIQGTTDMMVPPAATTAFYKRLAARYGAAIRTFVRYFLVPGFGHASGTFKMTWDSLSALDRWVNTGQAPLHPVAVTANSKVGGRKMSALKNMPHWVQVAVNADTTTVARSRPLCEYPRFPRYVGSGNVNLASSFSCSAR